MTKEIKVDTLSHSAKAIRLDVHKEGNRFVGHLVFDDGTIWNSWQSWKTLKDLTENARCTFDGPIVRV